MKTLTLINRRYLLCLLLSTLTTPPGLAALPTVEPATPATSSQALFASTLAAAEAGDSKAQVELGNMYLKGENTPVNYQEALSWYEKAADQGNANGMFNIGVMHDNGFHVQKNLDEAFKWYQKAAALDFPEALYNLGVMYEYGQGVARDYGKAQDYYLKAAEMGEPSSQFSMGLLYEKGLGVERDPVLAYMWWDITGRGHIHAEHNRDSLIEELTPEQLGEAKRLADKWRTEHAHVTQLPPQVFPPGFE